MVIKAPQVKKILKDPVKAAELANLIYVNDNKLTIKRHPHGRGFYYTRDGKKIVDQKSIKRFKSLVIPPAWKNVRITHLTNGHIQVVGRDDKNRKQYRYHPTWSQLRNKTKFFKMSSFGTMLPQIRQKIQDDLRSRKMTKQKCLALVLRLMEETHIRIGNDYYAKNNKSYGLSTLRSKHLHLDNNKLQFEFVGKKGKKHIVDVENKKLQKLVLQCEEIPGWEVFKYYNEEGEHESIDSGMVNSYIHEITGDFFSAKDFRTWAASKIFFESLYAHGMPNNDTELKQNLISAYDTTANGLGNTRTVCKKYYVHPAIPEKYKDGSIQKFFSILDKDSKQTPLLSPTESVLLKLINQYKIVLD